MTDTPLHRAARALMKSQSGVDDFDALDDEMQAGLIEDVKAVLDELFEPSDQMILVGVGELSDNPDPKEAIKRAWQEMLKAARF